MSNSSCSSSSHALRGNRFVARCATYPVWFGWSVDVARRALTTFPRSAWERGVNLAAESEL